MLTYPEFDPVLLTVGPLKIHWYGMMYLIGFLGGWWLGRIQAARPESGWTKEQVDDLVFYIVLGVVLGGRFGYVMLYGFSGFLADPISLIKVWEGGMSFHGGLIGVIIGMWIYARKYQRTFFETTDFIAPLVTVGLGSGRLGNFINAELWGGPSDLPWAMRVSCGDAPTLCSRVGYDIATNYSVPVHPSQLYELMLEGALLLLILWFFYKSRPPRMAVSGMFLLLYGLFRFMVEFVRMPDAHMGYLMWDWVTMGQLLSAPMILTGILFVAIAYIKERRGIQAT